MSYRELAPAEIERLRAQGCTAEDWSQVQVADPFHPQRIVNTTFSGQVRIGVLVGGMSLPGGVPCPSGLFHARVHNCSIGDRSTIARVGMLANYRVGNDVLVENVGTLQVRGESSFGNGVEIDVMNEVGGRTLPLCDRLSAQLAYLIVAYRHQPELVRRLSEFVHARAASQRATAGVIGDGAWVRNTTSVLDMAIGPGARVEGAGHLEDGTLASTAGAPVRVGAGVLARHFIVLAGSTIEQGAILENCFVGEAVRMGRQFSAENSAFFCNSELFHGEACSVFAGPYTVSHHKSTLLIAGLFSFYNAGSGTNQSNHMYKLGPVHQGVVERGCKTGSFSYLFWPTRVGAFSSVIGKHYTHFDSSDLPFSVISEHDGRSVCIPGMNLFTVGTRRDSAKWPARDRRTGGPRLDRVHFELLSPYVISRVLRGMEKLGSLAAAAREGQEYLNFHGISVQKMLVRTASKYYETALRLFIGEHLLRRLEAGTDAAAFASTDDVGLCRWVDMAGLFAPEPAVARLADAVVAGRVNSLDELDAALDGLAQQYDAYAWSWCARLIEQRTGTPIAALSAAQIATLIEQWRDAALHFNHMVLQDARKEFDAEVRIGYGIDGDAAVQAQDFEAVRGTRESHSFIQALLAENEQISARAEAALAELAAPAPSA